MSLIVLLPSLCWSQGKITRPPKTGPSKKEIPQEPKRSKTPQKKEIPESSTTLSMEEPTNSNREPISILENLSLAVRRGGMDYYFSKSEWAKIKDKTAYRKLGIVIKSNNTSSFILALRDYNNQKINYYGSNKLPSKSQFDAIYDNLNSINSALEYFGGSKLKSDEYWTSEKGIFNLKNKYFTPSQDSRIKCYQRVIMLI